MSSLLNLVSRFEKFGLQEIVRPENAKWRPVGIKHSGTVATAETFTQKIESTKLIHAIMISIGESTTATGAAEQGTLADDLTSLALEAPSGEIKHMTADMNKALAIATGQGKALSTGFYLITFSDPRIPEAMPLPGWLFKPLNLVMVDNAPAGSNYHHVIISVLESFVPQGIDISKWKVLYERYFTDESYGTATGEKPYDHEVTRNVYGYLYEMDDDGTLDNDIFNKLKIVGEKPGAEHVPVDNQWISHIREENAMQAGVALPTGFFYVAWPKGYDTGQYKSLKSIVNIPTAGTDAGLRVLERYAK